MADENDENKSTVPPAFKGFSFNKTTKLKTNLLMTNKPLIQNDLIQNSLIDDNDGNEDNDKDKIDYVTSIDDKQIQGTTIISGDPNQCDQQQSIVIPLIKVNKYQFSKHRKQQCNSAEASPLITAKTDDEDDDSLVSKAKQELLSQDSSRIDDDDEELLPAWKSLLINKLPDEMENDTRCDVSMRPDVPKLNDYERIPVNVYGAAMLRGMGWQEGQPIGGVNKAMAPIIEPQLRPRGLGLGADISLRKQLEQISKSNAAQNNSKDSTLVICKGCYVCIEFGQYKGYYGIVEDLYGIESIYARIKLTLIKDRTVDILQDLLRVVSKQEYDSESKVLNRLRYDEYIRHHQRHRSRSNDRSRRRSRSSSRSQSRERRSSSIKDEYMDDDNNSSSDNNSQNEYNRMMDNDEIWIMPKLRVQIIDKNYKNGKYYKDKVIIVETRDDECICRTKEKRLLYNVKQSMLRTVIPSLSSSSSSSSSSTSSSTNNVMILRGKYQGKLAKIDEIDWKNEIAMINLSGYISKPFPIRLDDITEYRDDSNE